MEFQLCTSFFRLNGPKMANSTASPRGACNAVTDQWKDANGATDLPCHHVPTICTDRVQPQHCCYRLLRAVGAHLACTRATSVVPDAFRTIVILAYIKQGPLDETLEASPSTTVFSIICTLLFWSVVIHTHLGDPVVEVFLLHGPVPTNPWEKISTVTYTRGWKPIGAPDPRVGSPFLYRRHYVRVCFILATKCVGKRWKS
jgi:hypothetical protein